MSDVAKYFPNYYDNIMEIDALKETENELFDEALEIFNKVYRNQFVVTCDSEGIVKFETLLKIIANPAVETLQFRIERVINRLNQNPPYTLGFLKLLLDDVIGKNRYTLKVENNTLYLETSIPDQSWFEEVSITVNAIKPCNIVFINKPVITDNIKINEEVAKSKTLYARLGSLRLGYTPFVYKEGRQVVKSPETKSIQNNLITYLGEQTKVVVHHAIINDSTRIEDFLNKTVSNGVVTLEYNVPQSLGISQINNIKLYDETNKMLTSTNLYVPVSEDVIVSHQIRIQEG